MPSPQERLATALADRYRIERELGQGGMATVYLAQDLRHERRVALKVLKPELAAVIGAERFLQEIKTTANLQHPHILGLIDSGEADGLLWYVMPYVEGESLRDRLSREKQLPVDEAVRLTSEVASALDYAHRHGVIHRDIKPENILLHDRQALVADFGISLAVSSAGGSSRMTETGMSLGTPQYMSPEQAMGDRALDARSDIYSLGAMLYEMLAGDPPYTGSTAQAIVAKVLTEKAPLVTMARETVPPHVAAAIQRALAKLAADRFATAAEFADALNRPGSMAAWTTSAGLPAAATPALRVGGPVIAVGAVAVLAIGALAGWLLHRPPPPAKSAPAEFFFEADSTHRLELLNFAPFTISPDGTRLAYLGRSGDAQQQIYERRLGDVTPRVIAGTVGGDHPFYSPDGEWIGFDVGGVLRKVKTSGGGAVTIARIAGATTTLGAAWGTDGTIVFAGGNPRALYRVSAEGGTPEQLAVPDSGKGENHARPSFLPDGKGVLFVSSTATGTGVRLGIVTLPDRKVKYLSVPALHPRYVGSGELVYGVEGGALEARPFDIGRLDFAGPARRLVEGVFFYAAISPTYDISPGGVLVYRPGASGVSTSFVVLDRAGRESTLLTAPDLWGPRYSPRGDRVAYVRGGTSGGGTRDVWVYDIAQGTGQRLTHEYSSTADVAWSPDGASLLFSGGTGAGGVDLLTLRADGTGEARPILVRPDNQWQGTFTRDGKRVVFDEANPAGVRNLFITSADSGGAVEPIARSAFNEMAPAISPDGRWLAYHSDESGQAEVYVRPLPGPGPAVAISRGGGREPAWAPGGRELFYRQGNVLMSASLDIGTSVSVRERKPLFDTPSLPGRGNRNYDVAPDGNHFLFIKTPQQQRLIIRLNALAPEPR